MEASLLFSLAILFLFLFTLLKLSTSITKNPQEKLQLLPGPPKLPIIGNLHQLLSNNTPPHRRLQQLAQLHGPIMHLRLGEVPTVVISSADMARKVMRTHDADFANRPKLLAGKEVYFEYSDIGFAPYGEYWRQVRKIATLELFTAKRVQSFQSIREEETMELINSIASVADSGTSLVNLGDKVFGLVFNIMSRVVFNKKGRDQEAFSALLIDLLQVLAGFAIADLYPSIKLLPSISGIRRKLRNMVKESNKILDPIIDDHKSIKKHDKEEEDLVDVLLKYHSDDKSDDTHFSLTTNSIKAIILEIFAAGSETSSTTIEWAMSELLKHPRAMTKVQAEIRQVYKGKGIVDETRLDELKFLKCVIKETLRLHPSAPLLAPRESLKRCQIGGYDIPSKTRVIVNAWTIGRDPKYWPEPDRFWPERFEDSSIDFKGTNFELIPFGAGRRMCPGMTLAVANVELPLAMLLYHFDWKLPTGVKPEDLDMDELAALTVRRKNDLKAIPIPYTFSSLAK